MSLFLLVHPWAALLITLAVLTVDIFLFGELWLFGIRFNTVSVVNLVMAVGLAADYSIHIMHKFLSTDGDSKLERVQATMKEIGMPVLLGGLTTVLGVVPLAFASSTIFRTFFAMLFGTALFGVFIGMVVVPIALIYTGPAKFWRKIL